MATTHLTRSRWIVLVLAFVAFGAGALPALRLTDKWPAPIWLAILLAGPTIAAVSSRRPRDWAVGLVVGCGAAAFPWLLGSGGLTLVGPGFWKHWPWSWTVAGSGAYFDFVPTAVLLGSLFLLQSRPRAERWLRVGVFAATAVLLELCSGFVGIVYSMLTGPSGSFVHASFDGLGVVLGAYTLAWSSTLAMLLQPDRQAMSDAGDGRNAVDLHPDRVPDGSPDVATGA